MLGHEESLLQNCYRNPWGNGRILELGGKRPTSEEARDLYFRVTGHPFNSVPPPFSERSLMSEDSADSYDWDTGQGGDKVAERLKGLSLSSSQIDGLAEPKAALGYYEWTLVFRNDAQIQREARAQILLPPGGVVSRLTLWVNGEPREAAFGGRSQVKAAYQEVAIEKRRDPVLVTTSGPDRVLMQCFPVPPSGGTMKIRLGITAPMILNDSAEGKLRWPILLERNFRLPETLHHTVWFDSTQPLRAGLAALKLNAPRPGQFVIRGDLTDTQLNDPESTVIAERPAEASEIWSPCEATNSVVHQQIVAQPALKPGRIVIVVDGSGELKASLPGIAKILGQIPEGVETALLLASDELKDPLLAAPGTSAASHEAAAKSLRDAQLIGGQDNLKALTEAWDLAAERPNSVVLWIHGACPVLVSDPAALRQRFERQPDSPRVFEFAARNGPNRLMENLDGLRPLKTLPRLGTLESDLARVFSNWGGTGQTQAFTREKLDRAQFKEGTDTWEGSGHVTRLWAKDSAQYLASHRKLEEATKVASEAHIVTPTTGAVVLETKAQFDQAGLSPADASKVPVIPEPSTWALLILGIGVCIGKRLFKKRTHPPFMQTKG